ncbi:hypothetical protein G6O69_16655 [Pseudenhygromyxa sp. WMMC2535]|uniref:MYXO-CTERM sorting domain-containing protein n=1 Tax=Pseudenhygromyxa sp. WMMC2535 TaxID=2712867 RepID=UPI001595D641|nr:MYXO-CTERM sorting domain-containing protein [Pseudenhygromyxa sp. WMMC2535]NVB39475.1 hypothetical protein [Pseudenhygromyxa sp. WMMC2535]
MLVSHLCPTNSLLAPRQQPAVRRLGPFKSSAAHTSRGELVDLPAVFDGLERRKACMIMAGGRVYWEDGRTTVIFDGSGRSASACLCLTEEEFETKSRHDELDDMLYELCETLAVPYEADSNDCLEHYEAGTWLPGGWWAEGEFASMGRNYPPCEGDEVEGCRISERGRSGGWLALALLALVGMRRRRSSPS